MTRLLSAQDGRVYLDVQHPRVFIRGAEDRSRIDLGYSWLPEDEVFPFFELRAAAHDLRDGSDFDPHDTRRRVAAQLHTLREHGIRHVVLGAFGCGAFKNPADRVARVYREEIAKACVDFSVIAFAVFWVGIRSGQSRTLCGGRPWRVDPDAACWTTRLKDVPPFR